MTGLAVRSRLGAAAVGAAVGASAWLSMGALALVDAGDTTRVGTLPAWSWLAGLAVAAALVTASLPLPPRMLTPLSVLALLWLPWLPMAVPPVCLLWEGPIEGAVWLAAVGGVCWTSGLLGAIGARVAKWSPRRALWVASLLPIVAYACVWWSIAGRLPSGDEPHYLVITQSLLRDGDLRIENNHREMQYLEYFNGELRPDFRNRGTDRQIYSIHAPGLSVLIAPAFAIAGYPGAVLVVLVGIGVALGLLWRAGWLLTGSTAAAWIGWLAAAVSAPVALHGGMIYPDTVGTAAVMAGVVGLVMLETGRAGSLRTWCAVGAALAWLPWLHTRFAVLAVGLGLALALRLHRRAGIRAVVALLTVPAVAACGWFAYFWLIWGTPNPVAAYGASENVLSAIPQGLMGLLFDQEFGLLPSAPVLAMALASVGVLGRRRPRLALELGAVSGLYLLAVASYPMWWGGYSAPARFVVVIVPLLAVPLAAWWAEGSPVMRSATAMLAIVSAAITGVLALHDGGAFVFNGRDGRSLLLDWLSSTVDVTLALPSVHAGGTAGAAFDAVVWVACCAAAAGTAAHLARTRARAWAAAWAPVAAIMAASTLVWAGADRSVATPSASQAGFASRGLRGQLPVALQLTPTRLLVAPEVPSRLTLSTSARRAGSRATSPLLRVPEVPAGDYDVYLEAHARLQGTLTVLVGRQSYPVERWPIEGRPAGFGGLTLHLPVDAHSVTIDGDAASREVVDHVALKPRTIEPGSQPWALRSARYGRVVVYALDDYALIERTALWTRGARTARMVVAPDAGAVPLVRLTIGPVANTVTLAAGTWTKVLEMTPGQTVDVVLPPDALAPAVLAVTTSSGFRPSSQPGGSSDVRYLGVYLTWPDSATGTP